MSFRVAPALVAALGVARSVTFGKADASPPEESRRDRSSDDLDVSRALAVMERYHRMSMEAIKANVDSTVVRGSGEGVGALDPFRNGTDSVENRSGSAVLLEIPGLETQIAEGTDMSSEGLPVRESEKSSPGISPDPLSSSMSPQPTSPSSPELPPPATLTATRPKKKRVPRVPASTLFEDQEVSGDACVPHVIIGGGTSAWAAVQAMRRRDPSAEILVVTEEQFYPYNRTPLSKELWAPDAAGIFTSEAGTRAALEYSYAGLKEGELGRPVGIIRGKPVVSLDIDRQTISFGDGLSIHYKNILLATGGLPRPPGDVCQALETDSRVKQSVSVFRGINDFRELRESLSAEDSSVAVVGGGFLGTELAVAMASEGRRVSLLCAEPGVLYKVLPRYLSQFLSRKLTSHGINVIESATLSDASCVSEEDNRVVLSLSDEALALEPFDNVVVATGIRPRVELAKTAGLEIDDRNGGIVVNDQMSAEANVYVAGDVASYWDRSLGRRRVEHWDHAVVSGKIAGDRMVGGDSRYGLQSMFWSDLDNVEVSFQAVGRVENGLETVAAWNLEAEAFEHAPSANKYREGVVWYVRDRVVVGAVLWNLHGRKELAAARKAISSRQVLASDVDAAGLLPLPEAEHKVVVRTEALDVSLLS